MGIGSWWKNLRGREDAETAERAEERTRETPEERKLSSESIDELKADRFVARSEHEPSIEDADRLGEADD